MLTRDVHGKMSKLCKLALLLFFAEFFCSLKPVESDLDAETLSRRFKRFERRFERFERRFERFEMRFETVLTDINLVNTNVEKLGNRIDGVEQKISIGDNTSSAGQIEDQFEKFKSAIQKGISSFKELVKQELDKMDKTTEHVYDSVDKSILSSMSNEILELKTNLTILNNVCCTVNRELESINVSKENNYDEISRSEDNSDDQDPLSKVKQRELSSYGTEFYVSSSPHLFDRTALRIDIASPTAGVAQLDVPFLRIHRNITLQRGSTTINISSSLLRKGSFLERRGIRIKTNVNVSVYITSLASTVRDTYLALPVPCLGQQYKVASYDPNLALDYNAYLAVIGTKYSTQLSIRFINNTVISATLQEFDVYQVADRRDLTGTYIESSKPVSVISGVPCANVLGRFWYCDCVQEQMTPLSSWSTIYIIPPVIPRHGFALKILTKNSNSIFHLANLTDSHYNRQEFLMGTDPVVVTSSSPVSVIQFGVGQEFDDVDGNAFMTVVPAVDNFLSQYYFVVPDVYSSYKNYLSVIVLNTDVNNVRLDGSPLSVVTQYKVPSPFNNYTVVISNISTGYHELRNENMKGRFGAIVYGLKYSSGYGFPVGFAFHVRK